MTLYGKFEDISRETNKMLIQVGETIRDLKSRDDFDKHSVSSSRSNRSVASRKSQQSKSSRGSLASTSSSARQRCLDLEEQIATLTVKMDMVHEREEIDKANRYALDEIQQRKLEFQNEEKRLMRDIEICKEKLRIKEELAKKKARVEVCTRLENEAQAVILDDKSQSDKMKEHIERFLEAQAESLTPHSNENNKPAIPNVMSNPPQEPIVINQPGTPLQPHLDTNAPIYFPNTATTSVPAQAINTIPFLNYPATHSNYPIMTDPNVVQAQLSTIAKLLEVQHQSRLPLPEPGIFSSDPLHYPIWIKAFETLLESRAVSPAERLHFLGKYVSGEAKNVVNGFMLLDSEDAYNKAKEMLAKRFGDPFTVASGFRKKLEEWKPIASNDAIRLRNYADLVQCKKAMEKVSSMKVLNDDQENLKMTTKLPRWVSNRWARLVYKPKEEKKTFPPFSEFVKFLISVSNIACDLVSLQIGRNNEDSKRARDPKKHNPLFKLRSSMEHNKRKFATRSEERDEKDEKSENIQCHVCKQNHNLNSCKQFCKMDINERKKFVTDKGLCYGCLGNGHVSKNCKRRKTCETCKKSHPTSLHSDFKENPNKDKPKSEEQTAAGVSNTVNCSKACFMSDGSQVRISSRIVPVWIHPNENPELEKLVYALLDDQSDTAFITQETLNSLDVSSPEAQLTLSTMHAHNEVIASHKVKGLTVCDFDHDNSIPLPTTFSCTIIPARRTQIPCPEMTSQWPHLASIEEKLMPHQHNIEVGLLIGSNCSRAIMPREIIPAGPDNGSYAQRTDLGWGIIGNITKSKQELSEDQEYEHVTHLVISRHVTDTNQPYQKACRFSIKSTTKEVINPAQVRQMMESDFSENANNDQPLSLDDKMEGGIRQQEDGHYEMPLPFREEPKMPNNKTVAINRLTKLKTRLDNDEQYRKDYVAFTNDLIERKYAERLPEQELSSNNGHTWYIPHHGVYHPKNPQRCE